MKTIKGKLSAIPFQLYCRLSEAERKKLALHSDEKEFQEAEKVIASLPKIKVESKIFVEGEEDIVAGDVVTISIKLIRENYKEHEKAGFIHSNVYPFLKKEQWFFIMTDIEEKNVMGMDKIVFNEKTFEKEIKQRFEKPGQISVMFHLKNDSYKGFDVSQKITFKIEPTSTIRKDPELNPEDKALLKAGAAGGLLASMMENQEDSEDEEEDETELQKEFRA